MSAPEWWGLDREDLDEYVRQITRIRKLNEEQSRHLHWQLSWKLGYWPNRHRSAEENALIASVVRDTTETRINVGSGLTARIFIHESRTGEAERFYHKERKTIKRNKRRIAKRPFWALVKSVRYRLEDALWACGCLQIAPDEWIIPVGANKPHEGIWWYQSEIERHLGNAENQAKRNKAEFAARNAFMAGQLFAELEIRLAHNDFFEKQRSITEAQRSAPQARRTHTDEVRRDRVRYYMMRGDKPTIAAGNAAKDLGVSLSTIRRAFPDNLLPEDSNF